MVFDVACDRVLERFKLENLKDLQRKALEKLVNGEDVFVIQPTGSGKSLIYQSSPMAIDIVKETTFKSIAVVISPLTSLMQDQVKFLKSIAAESKRRRGRLPDRVWTDRSPPGIFSASIVVYCFRGIAFCEI